VDGNSREHCFPQPPQGKTQILKVKKYIIVYIYRESLKFLKSFQKVTLGNPGEKFYRKITNLRIVQFKKRNDE